MTSIILFVLLAQTAPTSPPAQDKAKAKALLTEGSNLYEKGDFTGALENFHSAYAAYSSPKIWFNIGQANRDLGRPVEALEAFQKFLDGAADVSAEDKADAQSSVGELQKRLGQLTIVCDKAGAALSLDGKALGPAPLANPVWAVPGTHQVTAIQKGAIPVVESAEVNVGVNTRVVLKSAPVAIPAEPYIASPNPVDVVTSPKSETSRGWWLGRKWTWVAAGSTVLFTGATVGLGWGVSSRFDELRSSCGQTPGGCSENDISSLRTRRNTANVLWGLAGAAAVTTGVLFFVEGRSVAVAPIAGETTGMVARMEF